MMRESISRRRAVVNWQEGLHRAIIFNNMNDVVTGIREGNILQELAAPICIRVGARQSEPLLTGREVNASPLPARAHPIHVSVSEESPALELVLPALCGCHEAAVTREGVVPCVTTGNAHATEEARSRCARVVEEVREVLLAALPLSRANLAHQNLVSPQHRQVYDRAGLVDLCARVYRQRGRPFLDPVYGTRIYTDIYMEKPFKKPNGSTQHPPTFFEVTEMNPLDAQHRLLLRNALVAQVHLATLREKVGHFWTHPIRNCFLLNQDGKSDLAATTAKGARARRGTFSKVSACPPCYTREEIVW